MNDKTHKNEPLLGVKSGILEAVRQWCFPLEFRIAAPGMPLDALTEVETAIRCAPVTQPAGRPTAPTESSTSNELVADLATCLWYLKTKHFNRKWEDDETGDDDPRVRRSLSRLNKGITALKGAGVEVHDPTNKRYPQGGEGMMRPLQFQPTAGLTFEVVSDTVAPIIYRDDRLIQRGEVFVAVPKEQTSDASASTAQAASPSVEEVPVTDESLPSQAEALTTTAAKVANCGAPKGAAPADDGSIESLTSKQVAGATDEEVADEKRLGPATSCNAANHETTAAEAELETYRAGGEPDSKQEPKTNKDDGTV